VLLTFCTLAWLLMQGLQRASLRWKRIAAACTVLGWLAAAALEVPYHLRPMVSAVTLPALGVIGDSVTAGMQIGENEPETWPKILARSRHIRVNDQSQPGAKCASAMKQAALLTPADTVVVMEIGGNDLLGTTSAADFERDLQALLSDVCRPGRTVVLFELPLLPFCQGYGRAQRRLCREYGVYLIPKHVLLGVLRAGGATIDSIHLTAAGQQHLADETWRVIGPAFAPSPVK
jgi:acyl-CoA thioesterase-1